MSPSVRRSFSRLHATLHRHFGGDLRLWIPAQEKGTAYTVPVPCRTGAVKGQSKDLAGMLTLPTDAVTVHADLLASDGVTPLWLYTARPGCVFVLAAAVAGSPIPVTVNTGTGRMSAAAHGLADGDAVTVEADTLPAPLLSGPVYFVTAAAPGDFRLSPASGAAALNFTTAGTGVSVRRCTPAAGGVKYQIETADTAPQYTHLRITASRQ